MKAFRRILHATDFSPASGRAFTEALRLARGSGAELLLVHVLVPPTPIAADGFGAAAAYEAMAEAAHDGAEKGLARLLRRARTAGVRVRALLAPGGAPHEQIVRIARRRRVDLVVVGTHGRSGLPRLFLGSVAGRVVSLAACPVLTVRGR
jgi:nucleotide-binding universal stress UspA family protein